MTKRKLLMRILELEERMCALDLDTHKDIKLEHVVYAICDHLKMQPSIQYERIVLKKRKVAKSEGL